MLRLALALVLISGAEEPLLPVSRVDETRQARETKARHLEKSRRARYDFIRRPEERVDWYEFDSESGRRFPIKTHPLPRTEGYL